MSAAAIGLIRFEGMMLHVELAAPAPDVGRPREVRVTFLPLCLPENGLKMTVFAGSLMLLRLTMSEEKSPLRIACVGTVKSCGSATLSKRCSWEKRKEGRPR